MAKTVQIIELIRETNRINAESTCHPEGRMAINSFLEGILLKNDVYHGFGYLCADDMVANQPPGIISDPSGNGNHQFPDESRRFYYIHHRLRATKVRTEGVRKYTKKVSEKS